MDLICWLSCSPMTPFCQKVLLTINSNLSKYQAVTTNARGREYLDNYTVKRERREMKLLTRSGVTSRSRDASRDQPATIARCLPLPAGSALTARS